jgi:anti-sigma factor RsiW
MMTCADEMSCQELVELITDYLEGALSAPDRTRFEAHLSQCPGCRNYVEQMRTVMRLAGRVTTESVSPAAANALLEAFRRWKAGGSDEAQHG